MKQKLLFVLALGLLVAACDSQSVLTDFDGESASKNGKRVVEDADSYLVLFTGRGVDAVFESKVQQLGGSVDFSHEVGVAVVSGITGTEAATLSASKTVSTVVADASYSLDVPTQPQSFETAVASPTDPTTASKYSWQWNMRAIGADQAWAAGRLGSSDVTVAILDSGIDYEYPDLVGRVDLSRSASFVPEDDVLVDAIFPGKHHVTDLHFHGTHVAATVASNALAAAGVTSQTTLIGVKVCGVAGECGFSATIMGFLHAVANGADVINMSIGGYWPKWAASVDHSYAGVYGFINRIFNYANSMGVTVVVAAGNESVDLDKQPALYKTYCDAPNAICVSATGPTDADEFFEGPWHNIDAPAVYTNFGRSAISVAAPGGNTGGTIWAACSTTSLIATFCQDDIYVVGLEGTSMATPHVSGLAALLVEDYGRKPSRIKAAIQIGADDLGQRGVDKFYGKGRINVPASLGL